jgi:hypothetical protein
MALNYKYLMDNEEFKQKLSEVATWEIPDVTSGGNPKKKPGRPSAEDLYQQEHEEVFLDLFDGKNPTLHPVLTNVKVAGCMCDDCGKLCENGRKAEKSKYYTNRPHWRARCLTCGLNQNPYTGEWDLTNETASPTWSRWLRQTSEKPYAYKPKASCKIAFPIEKKEDK